jgi:hypothetical protein
MYQIPSSVPGLVDTEALIYTDPTGYKTDKSGALAVISCCTNAVVANCVVFVVVAAVGAVGVPVNVGDAMSAFVATAISSASNSSSISVPLTIFAAFPVGKASLLAKSVSLV